MNELRNRGTEDILLAVVDGLKGFPEAILVVFPEAMVQICIVHLLRLSLDFVSHKDCKSVAVALKAIYRADDAEKGPARTRSLRKRALGPALSGYCRELATRLERNSAVLWIPS